LAELLPFAKGNADASLLSLTALGQQSSQGSEVLPTFEADVRAIQDFRCAWGQPDVVDMIEFALPKGAAVDEFAPQVAEIAASLSDVGLRGFFEVPFTA